jgi:hypothetical protein
VIGQRIGITGVLATAIGDTHLIPADPSVAQCFTHRIRALSLARQAIGTAERVQTDANDRYVIH